VDTKHSGTDASALEIEFVDGTMKIGGVGRHPEKANQETRQSKAACFKDFKPPPLARTW